MTGVDSAAKLDMMRSLGCERAIDYTREDFTEGEPRYDLILDVKTNRSIFKYLRVLNTAGVYVTVGGSTARVVQAMLMGPLIFLLSKKKVRVVLLKPNKDLIYMTELFEAGQVKPVLDGHYKLSEVPEAMRYFGEGNQRGKVVITI